MVLKMDKDKMGISKKSMAEHSKALIQGIVNEKIDLPDNALVFFDIKSLLQVVNPERMTCP